MSAAAATSKPVWTCPICEYEGPFAHATPAGIRAYAACPSCGALERHRLQQLAMLSLSKLFKFNEMRMLHIAPEPCLTRAFKPIFFEYVTADLNSSRVDLNVDITRADLADESFDVVYASHVLEHIADDVAAIREIRRILKPNGFAVLPVPIVTDVTVEYDKPNPAEYGHVRAPGLDYFDRYRAVFSRVKVFDSNDFDERYQTFVWEKGPTGKFDPSTPIASRGIRHRDFVPVCSSVDIAGS